VQCSPSDIFVCKNCGQCCIGYGGTFVTDEDIKKIAEFLHEDPETFVAKYCRMSCGKPLLAQGTGDFCVFWGENCKIHPVKPRMCRAWPFIPSVLNDIENWHIMAKSCPGMRTDLSDRQIRNCVEKTVDRTP